MIKKGLITLTLMFVMMPMLAQAFFLTTKVNTAGGQLQAPGSPVQTSASVMKSYPNGANVDVVVTANAGYTLSKVQVGANYVTPTPTANPYTYTFVAPVTSQTIGVWFAKQLTSVSAFAGVGGSVSPSGTLNLQAGTSKLYTFTPAAGKSVQSISNLTGLTYTLKNTSGTDVTLPYAGTVNLNLTVPASAVTLQASFLSIIANAGSPQTVLTGSPVTLDGSASVGATSYSWTQTGGPGFPTTKVIADNTAGATQSFSAAAAGSYQFKLIVSDGVTSSTAYTNVTASSSAADAVRNQCQDCHQPLGVGVSANVYANWSSSVHKADMVVCYKCHVGANTGGHPGVAASCSDCHLANGAVDHSKGIACKACHTSNSDTHTANLFQKTYTGLAGETKCQDCHTPEGARFMASYHWNNHLEYGPEFTEGAVEGQLDANNSYTTKEDGALVTCAYRCHFKPGMGPDPTKRSTGGISYTEPQTGTVYSRPTGDACFACHDTHGEAVTFKSTCLTCHSGSKHGKVPNEFYASKHWQNNLETGPEFANQMNTNVVGGSVVANGTIDGVLNANDSYTTTENGGLVTCAYRCHFRPGMGPDPTKRSTGGISYTDPQTAKVYNRPTGDACLACHDSHGLDATYKDTCLTCHSGSKHGKVPTEFFNSKHWKSSLETGPEFANQINTTVVGGSVVADGTVEGVLNANDSYTTTENGGLVTCAYRCHFRPGMYPEDVTPPAAYVANKKATTYVMYSSPYGAGKFSRPGGNACMACHNPHGLEATARSTCYTCHTGKVTSHGWAVITFEASSHFTSPDAVADGLGGPTGKACTECHNAHSTEISFATMSTARILDSTGFATGCQKCHKPGQSNGIFNADLTGKAPHFTDNAGAYVTARTTCGDCHNHKTAINKGWAESGHGSINAQPFNGGTADDWKSMGSTTSFAADPSVRNCNRCHTAKGFAQFVDSGFTNITPLQAANAADLTSEPLVCSGCHTHLGKGTLRTASFGTTGYLARYGYKNATISGGVLINSTLQFSNMKNSNICIPCHSQRGSGQEIKELYAAAFMAYSSGSNIYAHAYQPAGIVDGKGGYDFTTPSATFEHNNFGATDKQGPCAGCHMTAANTHTLQAVNFGNMSTLNGKSRRIVSSKCGSCHDASLTVDAIEAKKTQFDAAVKVLGNLLAAQGLKPGERVNFDWSKGTKDRVVAEKNQGAWFNWFLFTKFDASVDGEGSDRAAYVHNPSYTKRLVRDSIDWLDDHTMNNSVVTTINAQSSAADISTVEAADATLFATSPILP